nr:MAG: terminase large subunit [Caudoviricetes sp.]
MSDVQNILEKWRLPRPDRSPIYEWARKHVVLPESYATPGPFNAKLTPWLLPIFDALQDPLVRRVHFRKAVQVGGTLVADVWIPWVIVNDPGPISWTMQTEDMVERHAKSRLNPILERCKPVASMLPRPGPQRTTTETYFGGFFLTLNPANLSTQQSQSIRYKVNDEIWLPRWQEVYGHAVARVSKFEEVGRSKIYNVSQAPIMDAETGNVEDTSFRSGHEGEWSVECPACKKVHPAAFAIRDERGEIAGGVAWDRKARRDDETWDVARVIESVHFKCPHCQHQTDDSDATRAAWKRTGRFVTQNAKAPADVRSYRVEAVVSRPMRLLAEEWAAAQNHLVRTGDETPLVEFRTKREARPWIVEKKTVSIFTTKSGYTTATYSAGQAIPDEAIRFMAIDRQQDHWWVEVGAFSTAQGPRYRQLWFGRIETRDQLRQLQQRYAVPDACVAQDRGYRPADVDRDCAEFGWRGMRGYGRKTWTMRDEGSGQMVNFPFSEPRVSDYRGGDVYYYDWSGDYFKDVLSLAIEGKGDLKWDMPEDVNPLYLEHLKGEHKVEVRSGVWQWVEVKTNAPNHGLDTSAMMLCMATIAGFIKYQPQSSSV